MADIPLLTKHLNTNKARLSSFKPNFGIIITPVFDNKRLSDSNVIITLPVTPLIAPTVFDQPTPKTIIPPILYSYNL